MAALSRPLDVFTMNPYLPACQCDIYVTRYCVSERVIEIFLTGKSGSPSILAAISLAESVDDDPDARETEPRSIID